MTNPTSESAKPVISSPDKPSIALLAERLHNACYSLGVADERYTSDYQVKKASDKAEAVKEELLAAVAAAIDAAAIAQTADERDAARYRWLSYQTTVRFGDGNEFIMQNDMTMEELDAAIDSVIAERHAAIAAGKGQG